MNTCKEYGSYPWKENGGLVELVPGMNSFRSTAFSFKVDIRNRPAQILNLQCRHFECWNSEAFSGAFLQLENFKARRFVSSGLQPHVVC